MLRALPPGTSRSVSLRGYLRCKRCGHSLRGIKTGDERGDEFLTVCDYCHVGGAANSSDRNLIEDLLALDFILTNMRA